MSEVRYRWANGIYDEFTLPVNGLPLGYIEIRPTTMNVVALLVSEICSVNLFIVVKFLIVNTIVN
jgi:hypothetical protein